jgi:polysaccharide biosynthesis transport protein
MTKPTPSSDPSRPLPALIEPARGRVRVAATPPSTPASAISLDDVYYTIFRHKWKISGCVVVGLLAAASFFLLSKPQYVSNAKLFVRYVVMEGRTVRPRTDDTITKSPDMRGETIIQSEQEILTSFDLARKVAESVGPEKILGKNFKQPSANAAAAVIRKGLVVTAQKFSSVMSIGFQHEDPEVALAVLKQTIDQYLKTHVEIHRAAGMVGNFLAQETDQLRTKLNQTEEELRKARAKAGIISLEDARRFYAQQMDSLRQQIFAARAEQAQRTSVFKEMIGKAAAKPQPAPAVVESVSTPESEEIPAASQTVGEPLPPSVIEDYRSIRLRQEALRKIEQDLLLMFTADNSRVKDTQAQLAEVARRRREIEEQYPALLRAPASRPAPAAMPSEPVATISSQQANAFDLEAAQLNALEVRINTLTQQLEGLKKEAANLDQLEGTIMDLSRRRELEEANYRRYAASLEESRISDAMGDGKVSNISIIQTPSPPFIEPSKTAKIASGIAFGGLALGLCWAFLIEFVLDTSVRRPKDIERNMQIPLFLTIPKQLKPGQRGFFRRKKAEGSSNANGEALVLIAGDANANPLLTQLNPYYETLRDRLIGYFESRNLTHKPKLVAVTSVGSNAGVTATATGLARCLSETGDGNVLLVDLTPGQGSAQYFHRGKPDCGLEQLLETGDGAQVHDRLYVVSDASQGDKLSRLLPQRFAKLLPKLKSSDFDYVIFDMPPVSQISITPRLAGFMDMVLLVVESEKNSREGIQRASALLAESHSHVGAVLNKTKQYIPGWLHQPLPV